MTPAEAQSISVQSSLLATVVYHRSESILVLEFRDGASYQYFDVPAEIYTGLLAAESKGSYFNSQIRDCFQYLQVSRSR
jgi:hypothetical protein